MRNKQYLDTDYIIFEDGRCYSNKTHKFLTPKMSVKYPTYNLTIDGKKKQIKIHRMVAIAFIPNLENKEIVNHKDGDTHNFHVSNLEWVTVKENSQHAVNTGLYKKSEQILDAYLDNIIPGEKWVPIIGYSNYKISNCGRILNINTGKLKKTPLDNKGYPSTSLWEKGKGKTYQVHRIEFQSFFPKEELEGFVINHIDGNKTNNSLSNLEKATYSQNSLHAEYISKKHSSAKAVVMLDKNKKIIKEFPSIASAQRETGISNISRAIKKKYCAQGYYWDFKK